MLAQTVLAAQIALYCTIPSSEAYALLDQIRASVGLSGLTLIELLRALDLIA